jgi:hypothetical protein
VKNDTEEKNDARIKADSLAQTKPRNQKRKNDAKTTLKEKQIHSQENDTQSRLKHASRQKNLL